MTTRLSSASRAFLCLSLCAAAIFLIAHTLGRAQEGEEPPERPMPEHPPKPTRPAPNLTPDSPSPEDSERAGSKKSTGHSEYWTGGKIPVPKGIPEDWNKKLPPVASGNDYEPANVGNPPAPGRNYDNPELAPKPPRLPPPPKNDPDEQRLPPELPKVPPEPDLPKNDPDNNRKAPKPPKIPPVPDLPKNDPDSNRKVPKLPKEQGSSN